VNHSGVIWKAAHYGVRADTGRIDYDEVREIARRERPGLVVCGGSAYTRIIDFEAFRSIADDVGATLIVDMAHFAGLVAGGAYPSPVPHAQIVTTTTHKTLRGPRGGLILCTAALAKAVDKSVFPGTQGGPLEHVIASKAVAFGEALRPEFRTYAARVVANAKVLGTALADRGFNLVSGGTDSHMLLVDLRSKEITGRKAEERLGLAAVTVNRNTIPNDPASPFVTSGMRLGTPAVTTRGMGPDEMVRIAELIDRVISAADDAEVARVRLEVRELASAFPLYQPGVPAGVLAPA
jgi:glycine hydroxymethyltransferase